MAVNRKYADLPDLDSAPDIYETPELTDDNSTIPVGTLFASKTAASVASMSAGTRLTPIFRRQSTGHR
ncbi:hypothetical protein NPX13_g1276 [Xylaria arbuscula]|uniref:Uncharacterized protein n=1 Tax=Xylaria arbuscula TaxID=114810 RepID=A0A9W8TQB6_9PEZI|nr:hypothetical protein NPX13_g1276 [Xylaria arbuscula]